VVAQSSQSPAPQLSEDTMSSRRQEKVQLVNAWIDELLAGDSAAQELVLEQRAQRDSYSFDRPLLAASLSLPPRHAILSDLRELCPLLEAERLSEAPRALD
jgi:hypothetical protein